MLIASHIPQIGDEQSVFRASLPMPLHLSAIKKIRQEET